MDDLNIFQITLSNVEGAYYAGQNVDGHCTVELTQPVIVSGVDAQFTGEANVRWTVSATEPEESSARVDDDNKSTREIYFRHTQPLFQDARDHYRPGGRGVTLPRGRHTFPFSFPLPGDLPSSFKGDHGDVAYYVRVSLRRPREADCKVKKDFIVIGLVDLNLNPEAELPIDDQMERSMCCCCCESGPIVAHFSLQRMGHIPGEPLQFCASIHNNTNQHIDYCSIYLKEKATFHAEEGETNYIAEKKTSRIEAGSLDEGKSFTWRGSSQGLIIPYFLPPSGLPGCNIIDVSYSVTLSLGQGCLFNTHLTLPIIIGTLPSRYATSLADPPASCRPFQATPQMGYAAVPPPGCQARLDPTAPAAPDPAVVSRVSEGVPAAGGRGGGGWAPVPQARGQFVPPGCEVHGGAVGLPEDIAGQPPPSYEECVEKDRRRDPPPDDTTHLHPPEKNPV